MHSIIRSFVASAAIALCAPFASATVLTFDDLVGENGYATMPTNYGGLDWSASNWAVFTAEGAPFTPHSGTGRIATDFGSADVGSTIHFQAPTVFDGAWFAGYEDVSVRFDLYLNGLLVGSSSTLALSETSTFLDAGWDGAIDTVVVSSLAQGGYVMDDFSFQGGSEVPEPATLALVLAGLGLVGSTRRRRG